jgi:hypothetical protein
MISVVTDNNGIKQRNPKNIVSAIESDPVGPDDEDAVQAVLKHVSPQVAR